MLLLAALVSQAVPAPSQPKVRSQAVATVRIRRSSEVRSEDWARLPAETKREVVVSDDLGRPLLLRLVENQ
ncbi:MAG: hypothetical protein ACTHN4_05385 [Sphingomicrobium sp.]